MPGPASGCSTPDLPSIARRALHASSEVVPRSVVTHVTAKAVTGVSAHRPCAPLSCSGIQHPAYRCDRPTGRAFPIGRPLTTATGAGQLSSASRKKAPDCRRAPSIGGKPVWRDSVLHFLDFLDLQHEFSVLGADQHMSAADQATEQKILRQRPLDVLLNDPRHGSGAHLRVVAMLSEP